MTSNSPTSAPPAMALRHTPASRPATAPTPVPAPPVGGFDVTGRTGTIEFDASRSTLDLVFNSTGGPPVVVLWYMATCYRCGDGGDGMSQPFRDEGQRDDWAAGHIQIGHVVHLWIDGPTEPGGVLADLHVTALLKRDDDGAPRWLCPSPGCERWSDPYDTPQLALAAWRQHTPGARS